MVTDDMFEIKYVSTCTEFTLVNLKNRYYNNIRMNAIIIIIS